jgi:nucleoside-diphosphate-sugar epimerase
MRVFVTGATGHIGSAVVPELLRAGYQVTGLARSDRSVAALGAMGADVHRGDLDDLEGLHAAAAASDGVIHLAFNHDFSDFLGSAETDLRVVEAMGDALAGSNRPFVGTSGTLMVAFVEGRLATEEDTLPAGPRIDSENAAIALAERGVRSSVIRLAPLVHSNWTTTASPTTSSTVPARPGYPPISVTVRIAGLRCTRSTRRASTGWRWNPRPGVRDCTASPTRACRSATSPRSSAAT